MPPVIHFYSLSDDFGCFSNFAPYPIQLAGKRWPTSEHYFQAQKFEDPRHREEIRKANSPMLAARISRGRKREERASMISGRKIGTPFSVL